MLIVGSPTSRIEAITGAIACLRAAANGHETRHHIDQAARYARAIEHADVMGIIASVDRNSYASMAIAADDLRRLPPVPSYAQSRYDSAWLCWDWFADGLEVVDRYANAYHGSDKRWAIRKLSHLAFLLLAEHTKQSKTGEYEAPWFGVPDDRLIDMAGHLLHCAKWHEDTLWYR